MKKLLIILMIFTVILAGCSTTTTETTTTTGNTTTTTTTTTAETVPTDPVTNENPEEIGDSDTTGTNPEDSERNILVEGFTGEEKSVTIENTGLKAKISPSGDIYFPEGADNSPLVFIAHGSYNNSEATEYYKGFDYLAKAIANQGAVVVNMNLQPIFMEEFGPEIKDSYKLLKAIPVYLEELNKSHSGKYNPENIYLVGHSNMGTAVIENSVELSNIKGLISLSPIEIDGVENIPDIPIISLDGSYDGFIKNRAGYINTMKLRRAYPDRVSDLSYILVDNFSHYQYNSEIKTDDTEGNLSEEKKLKLVTPEVQQEVTAQLISVFIDNMIKGKHITEGLDLNKGEISEVKYAGIDYRSSDKVVFSPGVEGKISATDSEVKLLDFKEISGNLAAEDMILPLSIYEYTNPVEYIRVNIATSGSIRIPLTDERGTDLILRIAQISGDTRNNYKDGTLTAVVEYLDGGSKTVEFAASSSSLRYVEGVLEDVGEDASLGKRYSEYTIPMDLYITLGEEHPSALTLEFKESGSYLLGEVRIRKVGE